MSCSEYLGRYKQRLPNYIDTRPKETAAQHTDNVKRRAAAGNLETRVAATACTYALNAPSTATNSAFFHGGGHNVQDASLYVDYAAGQAYAQSRMPQNSKAPQIQGVCYSSAVVPEINDRIAADAALATKQAAIASYGRGYATPCCPSCKKVLFASGCNCSLTAAQAAQFKDARVVKHTIIPNVNVA